MPVKKLKMGFSIDPLRVVKFSIKPMIVCISLNITRICKATNSLLYNAWVQKITIKFFTRSEMYLEINHRKGDLD